MRLLTPSVIALAVALAACSPAEEAATPAADTQPAAPAAPAIPAIPASADVKPFAIGELQAAALRDGGLEAPNDNKIIAIDRTKAEVDALLTANNLPTETLALSVQPLLVRSADKVMLFDAGAGASMGPSAGKLPASMQAAGIDPASVTDVFISHGHGDHVVGLVANGALAFPNATVHVSAPEWDAIKANAQMAQLVPVVEPKVNAFTPGAELVPGTVTAVEIKGHTPGHSGYRITSGAESLLYIGDTMHHHVVSVQRPDWTIAFDGVEAVAEASRKEVLETSSSSGQRIYAVHFPFPGLGRFEKQGETHVWVAEP
jgi:glyoxylase-like metal-dependent hydrolase (beta-lactamase superfamily II)